jgi:hypothetical protein
MVFLQAINYLLLLLLLQALYAFGACSQVT